MQCPRCQHANPPGMKFCGECAAPLAATCPSCGAANPPENKFCGQCAAPLRTTSTAKFAAPDSYTPKHLAEKILTSKSALEGERKQVTVLFADLKGSMELLADRDPEEGRRLLDPVLRHMMEAVHRYEGTVNQVMGDGIMALFGAPLAHEDHAVRACYAALRMQEAVNQYAEEVHRAEGIPLQIRVGLNSGEVVVRSIGSDLHMDYTAVGQTTHLAARMEQMAMPGTILITSETLALAEGYVVVKPLGARPVKGLGAPLEVYEVVGAGTVRSRLYAAAARGLTRFVGREHELDQLRQALERARIAHGQVVAVVGEPGVGKSRLYWEFTHSHRTAGWLVLESLSVSYGRASSYLPVIDLLKTYFQIQADDNPRKIREKVTGKVLALERSLDSTLPALLALLDVGVEDRQWQALDPPQRRQRTLDALKRLLLSESQVQPVMLLFEDLHWIDAETQAFLDTLVEGLPPVRILLLTNYRPEYQHRWVSKTYYTQIRLDPLPSEAAEDLLRALLGDAAAIDPLKRLLIERTEGNPFFLEESVRTLIEAQALVGERGAYRVARAPEVIEVPATVEAVLAARIDRLPWEEKRLLQAAAVVGKDVPYPVLHAISDMPEAEIQRGLGHLQGAEFLYETKLFPDHEYTFKHALTHQVAYEGILQDRRRALHGQIVKSIERLHPDLPDEEVEGLANHAVRGELWEEAVTYHRRSGQRAVARSANREAVSHFEQALAALERLPASRHRLERSVDLQLEVRTPLWLLGEMERALASLRKAEQLARALGDEARSGWVSTYLSNVFWMMGQPHEARAYGESARSAGDTVGDRELQVVSSVNLAQLHLTSGDFRAAQRVAQDGLELLEGGVPHHTTYITWRPNNGRLRALSGIAHAFLGQFDEGIAMGRAGLREAEATGHPFSILYTLVSLDRAYRLRGAFHECEALVDRALALIDEHGFTVNLALVMAARGDAYVHCDRVAEGVAILEAALDAAKAKKIMFDLVQIILFLGEGYLVAGRAEEALQCAREALRLARERAERGYEAVALQLIGHIASSSELRDLGNPEAHYRHAMELLEDIGCRPWLARGHLGLGAFYRRTGQRQAATKHLTTAAEMLGQMGMRYWLEHAEKEMKELR